MSHALTLIGHGIAITAVAAVVLGIFYGLTRDVLRWWDESRWLHDQDARLVELHAVEWTEATIVRGSDR